MIGFEAGRILKVAQRISGLSSEDFGNALRLLAFVLVAVLLLVGLAEWYRGYLRLDRLEQETEILLKLEEASEHSAVRQDSQLAAAYRDLREHLQRSAEGRPEIPDVAAPDLSPRTVQVVHGLLPWILFTVLIFVVPSLRPDEGRWQFLSGMLLFLFLFSIPFFFVPLDWPVWLRKWVLPFGLAMAIGWAISRLGSAEE